MESLTNEMLIAAYIEARQLRLEESFIKLLEKELLRRQLLEIFLLSPRNGLPE